MFKHDLIFKWVSLQPIFIQRKSERRFCAGSNPARGVSEIRDDQDLDNGPGWKRG